ncbi:hypothetical protein A3I50_03625 [Candidatus Roizmanbacteria bacterium RIFCSPLOWO2_02_FULL_37_9]|nr:MAG: hypothetical protein A2859_00520 [Candidatus Roizmanbacteria bacterium RIFCSPHIGHO2_01_FULL_37_16b]OGK31685.1 MAG: hypothetical protein A3F57_01675 [Candidatus Roizmanbacteria bacterium RIFCSPHIGHO2_12_FULL_36_11]OGK56284.1 MAG: hypothetical protein A3I50_03625 [Candidatus Roizmanbacteria bacterium RIFCSPLOWO2_02_FULL_37_9]
MGIEIVGLVPLAVEAFLGGQAIAPPNIQISQEKEVASDSRPVDPGRVCLGLLSDCGTPTPISAIINGVAGYNPTPKPGAEIKCIVEERCDPPPLKTAGGGLPCLGMMGTVAALASGLAFQRKLKQRNHKRKFRYY